MVKYCVVAFVIFLVAVNAVPLSKEELKKLSHDCIADSGVGEDVVKQAKKGHAAEDDKLDHYASCILKKLGLQNDHGKIIIDGAKDKLPDDTSEAHKDSFVSTCLHKTGSTDLKTALEIWTCYHKIIHS